MPTCRARQSVAVSDRCMSLVCGREQASIVVVINVTKSIPITLSVSVCVCVCMHGLEWNACLSGTAVMQYHYCLSSHIILL
jgi:hypothetical protein